MSGKNLVLELNVKMLSASQIAGFLNFNMCVHIMYVCTYLLKLQIDGAIIGGHGQAFPGIPKNSQKLKKI